MVQVTFGADGCTHEDVKISANDWLCQHLNISSSSIIDGYRTNRNSVHSESSSMSSCLERQVRFHCVFVI